MPKVYLETHVVHQIMHVLSVIHIDDVETHYMLAASIPSSNVMFAVASVLC